MNWDSIASLATAVGVAVAAWQIRESRKTSDATFEDSFDQQYRDLTYKIPVDALLGIPVDDGKSEQAREAVFNYLDLSNEQIYQRIKRRISPARWNEWASGINTNLHRPFFARVWHEVKQEAPGTFSYLERLESENFSIDPATWHKQ